VEAALGKVIGDIQGLAVDHGGIPIDIAVDAVVGTDSGTRIWGSVSCIPGLMKALPDSPSLTSRISIHQEGPTAWIVTLRSN
jgi:hypothetical protein